jgi:hypothetical protein
MPAETLPVDGFSAEYFPQIDGSRRFPEFAAAAKKSGCRRTPGSQGVKLRSRLRRWFAATLPQGA